MCHKTHCFLFYNLNLYPTPQDCFYILRFVGVHLDLFADLLDMHGNCCNISDGFHIPDFPEQFFLCKHMVWIFCQKVRRSNSFVVNCFSSSFTQTRRAVLSMRIPRISMISFFCLTASDQSLISGEMCFHPRYQLTWRKWFCDVIVRTKSKTSDLVNIIFLAETIRIGVFFPHGSFCRFQIHPFPEA